MPPAGASRAPARAAPLVAALALLAAGCLGPGADDPAPPFEVTTAEGATWNLTDHRGAPVVLDFMATWCEPCVDQSAEIRETRSQAPDAAVLSLSLDPGDNASVLRDWKDRHDADWPHAGAPAVATDYGITTIPKIVVVAPDGHVAWSSSGREVVPNATLATRIDGAR